MLSFFSASGSSKSIVLDCVDITNTELTQLIVTEYLTPKNLLYPSFISVSGQGSPQIMINDSGIWTIAGTIHAGQRFKIRAYSSSLYSTTMVTTITINSTTFNWKVKTRKALITPLPFIILHQINLEPNVIVYSNYIQLSGFEVKVPISVIGDNEPKISIDNGPYVSSGAISSGQTIRIKTTSANDFSSLAKCTLSVSNINTNFVVMTRAKINSPIPFEFEDINNVGLSSNFISNAVVPMGYDINLPIQISGGEYCINNDGVWESEPGELLYGQSIKLRTISPSTMGLLKIVTLTLGDFTTQWAITSGILTGNADIFSFDDVVGQSIDTTVTSDTVLITGLPVGIDTNISVSNTNSLKYLINNNLDFTMATGVVSTGDSLTLRMNSSQKFNSFAVGYVTVGGTSSKFKIKTKLPNTIPDYVQFIPIEDAEPNVFVFSNMVMISNIEAPLFVSIFGANSQFSINDSLTWQTTGIVNNGDILRIRVMSSPFALTTIKSTIIIGELIFDFSVITRDQKTTPTNFNFIPVDDVSIQMTIESNIVIISDIDLSAPISVINGKYRINNLQPSNINGLINNGDRLQLIAESASTSNTTTTVTVTIGSMTRYFSITTTKDVICEPFSLIPNTNEILAFSEIDANIVRILGFDTVLNVYIQAPSPDINIRVAVNDEPNQISNWIIPIDSTTPVATIRSGQYLAIRGYSGEYSVDNNNTTTRTAIVRISPTPISGVTSIFNITSSKLANIANIQGNTISIPIQDSRPDVYYYSDLLFIDCVGNLNAPLVSLNRVYLLIEVSHNYDRDFVQVSMNSGESWSNVAITHDHPFGIYVNDSQQILIRAKIPSDYIDYYNYMMNEFAISVVAKLWNVPANMISTTIPISQLVVLNINKF